MTPVSTGPVRPETSANNDEKCESWNPPPDLRSTLGQGVIMLHQVEPLPDKPEAGHHEPPILRDASNDAQPEPVTGGTYQTDVTTLTERIAVQLAAEGLQHPVAAAVAIALRGASGLAPVGFAAEVGLTEAELQNIEAGQVSLPDLPASLGARMLNARLEPLSLADLDQRLRGN